MISCVLVDTVTATVIVSNDHCVHYHEQNLMYLWAVVRCVQGHLDRQVPAVRDLLAQIHRHGNSGLAGRVWQDVVFEASLYL